MVHAVRRTGILWPLTVALLAPVIIIASAAILVGLLGIFVMWLTVVGVLVTTIVISDLVGRAMQRLAPAPDRPLSRQAVGLPGR